MSNNRKWNQNWQCERSNSGITHWIRIHTTYLKMFNGAYDGRQNPPSLKHEAFNRNIYLQSASHSQSNMEKRTRDLQKNVDANESVATQAKEKETIPKFLRHFLGYTTAHGLGRLGDAKNWFWKVFWSIICVGSFGMFGYQAHGLFMIFYSRPVTTSVRITFEKQVPFPAVTICNLNMLRSDAVPQMLKQELAQQYQNYNDTEEVNSLRRRRDIEWHRSPTPGNQDITPEHSGRSTLTRYDQATSTPYNQYPGDHYYNYRYPTGYYNYRYYDRELFPPQEDMDEQTLFLERFTTTVTRIPEDRLRLAGHQFEDFVTNCTWRGLECKNGNYSKWWYQSWNYKYGNCYTFNGGKDKNEESIRVLSTSKPGPNQGLSLRLNIEQQKYLKSVSLEAGVRVILHDQGVMPFPYLEGFSISPGMSTSVGIQKTVVSRVDRFGNNSCWDIDELHGQNIYRTFYNITKYTQQTCQNSCLGRRQFEKCGCSEYVFPSGQPACDAYNDTIRECLLEVHLEYNNDVLPCLDECRQPCSENVIQKTISASQWPSVGYEKFTKKKDQSFSSQNALRLDVFYNELNYQRIEESFTYDEISLLADIGGQLGLWIGVSVITCFETLELFVMIVVHLVKKVKGEGRSNVATFP